MVPVAPSRRAEDRALKILRRSGLLLLLATSLSLAVPFGRRAALPPPSLVNGRAALAVSGDGPLLAGAARVRLPDRAPVAGYPAGGVASGGPLYARALVLEAGPVRQILVSIEALLVPGPLEEALVRQARLGPLACLLLSATHTHAGVGGTWNSALAEWGGNGRYDAGVARAVVEAAAQAIALATAALGPARLSWGQVDWPAGPAERRSAGPVDATLTSVRIERPSGAKVAVLIDYAMHPTMEPREKHLLSGDWPGALSAALEAEGGLAMVLQGASGNATWSRSAGNIEAVAARIGAAAHEVLRSAPVQDAPRLACEVRLWSLPPAQASPAVPLLLRRGASNLLSLFAEPYALRTTLLIDGLTLLGVPGEPVGALAQAARAGARGKVAIVGLADGYVGYIEPPGGTGEAARTYFGPGLAESLGLWHQAVQ